MGVFADCKPGSGKIMGSYCLKDCPISFYAANTSTTSGIQSQTPPIATDGPITSKITTTTTPAILIDTSTRPVIGSQPPSSDHVSTTSQPMGNGSSKETSTLRCEPCAEGCANCTDSAPNACTVCLDGYTMDSYNICQRSGFIQTIKHSMSSHPRKAFITVVITFCVLAVLIFLLVFMTLQLRDSNKCLKRKSVSLAQLPVKYTELSTSDSDYEIEKYVLNGNAESVKVQISRPNDIGNGSAIPKGRLSERQGLLNNESD